MKTPSYEVLEASNKSALLFQDLLSSSADKSIEHAKKQFFFCACWTAPRSYFAPLIREHICMPQFLFQEMTALFPLVLCPEAPAPSQRVVRSPAQWPAGDAAAAPGGPGETAPEQSGRAGGREVSAAQRDLGTPAEDRDSLECIARKSVWIRER